VLKWTDRRPRVAIRTDAPIERVAWAEVLDPIPAAVATRRDRGTLAARPGPMNGQTEVTPIGQLVLARLLVAGDKGATGTEIKKALEPLIRHRWAGAELTEALEQALAGLETAGLIARTRKGKTERGTLTPLGRRHTLEVLGLDLLPPGTTWDKVKKVYLAALALGLPTPRGEAAARFGRDTGFQAALLKAQFGLPLDDFPQKLEDVIGALSWTLMGFPPGRKFDAKSVQAALLHRALGDDRELGPKPDPKKEAARLLARKAGARQAGKDELRLAVIRHWVDGQPAAPEPPQPVDAPEPPGAAAPLDLGTFARRVQEAARSSPSGRFGDNKVFIAHVWRALKEDPAFAALGPDGFKRRLAEANNARLLDLSRADLVEAMDPEDVRLSEVPYLGATFHFIRI
jgi:hypothetical protein